MPSSPGRYHTEEASKSRDFASRELFDRKTGEFEPLGKSEMVLGGVGSIRLAPRFVRGGEVCFLGATSNGVSHEGIPIVLPIDVASKLLSEVHKFGGGVCNLRGTVWPLPVGDSPIVFDRRIPRLYLFSEEVEVLEPTKRGDSLVTVAVTYSSTYEGEFDEVSGLRINCSKHWTFSSFDPSDEINQLSDTVDWLRQYAVRHTSIYEDGEWRNLSPEALSIVGDFDETTDHFVNPIEFPLGEVVRGQYDREIVHFYAERLNLTVNKEMIMGDKFENIHGSTIVNRYTLQNALNSARVQEDEEVRAFLKALSSEVEAAKDDTAGEILDQLNEEISRDEPRVSLLKRSWDALVQGLPSVAKIAGASAALAKLLT